MSAARALQEAVFEALVADAPLVALLGGSKVFDGAPKNAGAPYVHLGEILARDWSTATEAGTEISFAIIVWSRAPGRSEGLSIAERVVALLHDAALDLDEYRLVNLRHVATETARVETPEGRRDDAEQRAYVDAYQRFFDVDHPDFDGSNPVSPVYGGRMVDPAHLHLWAWDARPYPYFPDLTDVWSDGANWERGHWLNGRLGQATLAGLIAAVMQDHGFTDYAIEDVHASVGGYLVGEVLSARATLETLLHAFRVNAADAGDKVLFRGLVRPQDFELDPDDLVERADEPLVQRRRAQETELPAELVLRFIDLGKDYRVSAASSRRIAGESRRSTTIDLSAIIEFSEAEQLTDAALRDIWAGRERIDLELPPSAFSIEAGDILVLPNGAQGERLLAERIEDGASRTVSLRRVDGRGPPPRPPVREPPEPVVLFGTPAVRVIDIAPPDGAEMHAPRLAVFANPWPGSLAIYAATEGGGFRLAATLTARATIGKLLAPLGAGPHGLFDRANAIEVELFGGTLASLPDIDVLGGGNAAAVKTTGGSWEVLQFAEAELTGTRRYRLTRLLRGQCGSELAMATGAATGADFVLLDRAVARLPVRADQLGLPLRYRFGPARDDHAAPTFTEMTVTAEGRGLLPFAPARVAASRLSSGHVTLSWIRRTRFGGVGWELTEVPLNEASEAYRLKILDGADVVRSVDLPSPSYLYTTAQQIADFGAPTTDFSVQIAQLSAAIGPGLILEDVVHA